MLSLDEMLPEFREHLGSEATPLKACVLKTGLTRLCFQHDMLQEFWTSEDMTFHKEYIATLHSKLSASPHVMEISPEVSDLLPDSRKAAAAEEEESTACFAFHIWPSVPSMSMGYTAVFERDLTRRSRKIPSYEPRKSRAMCQR